MNCNSILTVHYFIQFDCQSYFYNTRSHLRREDKPPSYLRCLSCKTQLATRRCKLERRDLCFICYRREHLEGDGCWHDWESSAFQPCGVCTQHKATEVCPGCKGSDDCTTFSDDCWARTHTRPNTRQQRGILVEESTVGYGTGGRGNLSIAETGAVLVPDQEGGHPDHYYGAEPFGYV